MITTGKRNTVFSVGFWAMNHSSMPLPQYFTAKPVEPFDILLDSANIGRQDLCMHVLHTMAEVECWP